MQCINSILCILYLYAFAYIINVFLIRILRYRQHKYWHPHFTTCYLYNLEIKVISGNSHPRNRYLNSRSVPTTLRNPDCSGLTLVKIWFLMALVLELFVFWFGCVKNTIKGFSLWNVLTYLIFETADALYLNICMGGCITGWESLDYSVYFHSFIHSFNT